VKKAFPVAAEQENRSHQVGLGDGLDREQMLAEDIRKAFAIGQLDWSLVVTKLQGLMKPGSEKHASPFHA
jgi:hypothetical protein